MSCKEAMDIILSFVQFIAIIIASATAIYGINSWKNESKWKKRNELAEEILILLYECQEAIKRIRNPISDPFEWKDRKKENNEEPEQSSIRDNAYVVPARYANEFDRFNKLRSIKHRARIVFSDEIANLINEFDDILKEILIANSRLRDYYWQKYDSMIHEKYEIFIQELRKLERIIWMTKDNDDISLKIDMVINKADKLLSGKWI